MSDIQFNEPQYARRAANERGTQGLSGLVIRAGLAKDEKTARYVLLGVAGMLVAGIVLVFAFGGSNAKPKTNQYKEGQNVLAPPQTVLP